MEIDGKTAIPIRLWCPVECGGFIENEVLMYITTDKIIFYGRCSTCDSHGYVRITFDQLLSQAPLSYVV